MISCDKCGSENIHLIAQDGAVNDFRCRDCGHLITSVIIPLRSEENVYESNFLIRFKDSEDNAVELLYVEELMERLGYDYEQMDNVRAHLYETGFYTIEGDAFITYTFEVASTCDKIQYENSWKYNDGQVGGCKKQDWANL